MGGTVHLPKGYLKKAYEIVRNRGGVCIADEVSNIMYMYMYNRCKGLHVHVYVHVHVFPYQPVEPPVKEKRTQ